MTERMVSEEEVAAMIIACHLPLDDAPDTVCLPITMTAGDLRTVYAALTAAPVREEGGAVDEGRLFAEVPLGAAALYRDLENGIRPILATREEAPAEAGEGPCTCCDDTGITIQTERPCSCLAGDPFRAQLPAREEAPAPEGGAHFGDPCVKCGDAHDEVPIGPCRSVAVAASFIREQIKWERDGHASVSVPHLHAILSALRTQPQARENAQPVAWRMIGRDGSTISLQAEPYHGGFAHMMAADVGCTVEPLYTHPAHDAQPLGCFCDEADCPACSSIYPATDVLRDAVEALEPFAREADSWPELADDDTLALSAPDGTASAYDITMREIRLAASALAALQAEQGAK